MKEITIEDPSSLTIHRAATLFPMMEGPGLNDLVADIRLKGLLEAIVVYEGQVLDGRNRLKACELANIRPRFVEYDLDGSAVDWVFSVNVHRRHLTLAQRSLLVARQIELRALDARERIGADACVASDEPGRARTNAAELAKVGETSVRHAQTLVGTGVPELLAKVEAGEVSLSAAGHVARLPPEQQRELVRAGRETDASRRPPKVREPGAAPPTLPPMPVAPARRTTPVPPTAGDNDAPADSVDDDDTDVNDEDEDEDPSAAYFAKPPILRPVARGSFQVRHPKGTTRAEEAAKVDEVADAASSALHALTWMLLDWDHRQVWDMDFTRQDAGEISQHLLIASTKLEAWADVCHGRKKAPTRNGA